MQCMLGCSDAGCKTNMTIHSRVLIVVKSETFTYLDALRFQYLKLAIDTSWLPSNSRIIIYSDICREFFFGLHGIDTTAFFLNDLPVAKIAQGHGLLLSHTTDSIIVGSTVVEYSTSIVPQGPALISHERDNQQYSIEYGSST